jgi:hypothetical protein
MEIGGDMITGPRSFFFHDDLGSFAHSLNLSNKPPSWPAASEIS